jgi:hypothetical protein
MPDSREEADVDEDDFSDEQDSEEEGATSAAPEQGADPAMEKLRKENRALRVRLRRSEVTAKYGSEVVDLIPDELPIRKWDEFAERLHARLAERPTESPEDKGEPAETPEEPTPAEKKLAALSKAGSEVQSATAHISLDDWRAMVKDPAEHERAVKLRQAGLVDD